MIRIERQRLGEYLSGLLELGFLESLSLLAVRDHVACRLNRIAAHVDLIDEKSPTAVSRSGYLRMCPPPT